jgi:hypothetical protein
MPGMNDPKNTQQDTVPGTVMLSPASQQLIDVRYTEVRRADMKRTLRTVSPRSCYEVQASCLKMLAIMSMAKLR